ncbi:hypothetical protein PUNSTDRAFT_136856 [Punctularia strigosozonata HHB-11173 SS5]|uniref:uncharacterized protein n=1 Tax=Punctularia strigosozonata (strain HHB-11173) TaxID=741275 RepID=UPI00044162BB|nr:uncharacterized protein PUNSTDRAFT_136856 [Punctularia strigosozonata HHB-11173 SS5]EIN06062.1 hypothetical protein PUNSTDRAFT_136856 [Punctularia strigosozonata HHB-11173 SS5]
MKLFSYFASQAALNWMAHKMHSVSESDGLVVFPLNPGAVQTGMTDLARQQDETLAKIDIVPPEVVAGQIVAFIKGATRENAGGQFIDHHETRREL